MTRPYPEWICAPCADEAGGKMPANHIAAWHVGECGVCGGTTAVTQPRDWGYPKIVRRKANVLES